MDSSVSVEERDCVVCVKLAGKAGVDVATLLKGKLAEATSSKNFVIDWQDAEHVDASVLQVLLALKQSIQGRGQSLAVERDNPHIRQYLCLSGLAEHFQLSLSDSETRETDHA